MIPRSLNRVLRARPPRTRLGRPRLESLAAEFALLTRRRSRALQEIETLDQQLAVAAASFARLQDRIVSLKRQMDALSPDLRDSATEAPPEPVGAQPRAGKPVAHVDDPLTEMGRQWIAAAQAAQAERPNRTRRGKRLQEQRTTCP